MPIELRGPCANPNCGKGCQYFALAGGQDVAQEPSSLLCRCSCEHYQHGPLPPPAGSFAIAPRSNPVGFSATTQTLRNSRATMLSQVPPHIQEEDTNQPEDPDGTLSDALTLQLKAIVSDSGTRGSSVQAAEARTQQRVTLGTFDALAETIRNNEKKRKKKKKEGATDKETLSKTITSIARRRGAKDLVLRIVLVEDPKNLSGHTYMLPDQAKLGNLQISGLVSREYPMAQDTTQEGIWQFVQNAFSERTSGHAVRTLVESYFALRPPAWSLATKVAIITGKRKRGQTSILVRGTSAADVEFDELKTAIVPAPKSSKYGNICYITLPDDAGPLPLKIMSNPGYNSTPSSKSSEGEDCGKDSSDEEFNAESRAAADAVTTNVGLVCGTTEPTHNDPISNISLDKPNNPSVLSADHDKVRGPDVPPDIRNALNSGISSDRARPLLTQDVIKTLWRLLLNMQQPAILCPWWPTERTGPYVHLLAEVDHQAKMAADGRWVGERRLEEAELRLYPQLQMFRRAQVDSINNAAEVTQVLHILDGVLRFGSFGIGPLMELLRSLDTLTYSKSISDGVRYRASLWRAASPLLGLLHFWRQDVSRRMQWDITGLRLLRRQLHMQRGALKTALHPPHSAGWVISDSYNSLRQRLVNDFGSIDNPRAIRAESLLVGQLGIDGLIQHVFEPITDIMDHKDPNYRRSLALVDTFAAALAESLQKLHR